jgi:hypothetical protein
VQVYSKGRRWNWPLFVWKDADKHCSCLPSSAVCVLGGWRCFNSPLIVLLYSEFRYGVILVPTSRNFGWSMKYRKSWANNWVPFGAGPIYLLVLLNGMIWNQERHLLFAGYQWWTGVGDKDGEVEVLTLGGDSGQLGDWMPSCWIRTWSSNLRFEIRLLLLCTQTLLSHTYIIFATWFIRTLIRRLPNYRSTEYHGSLVPSCTMLLFIGT